MSSGVLSNLQNAYFNRKQSIFGILVAVFCCSYKWFLAQNSLQISISHHLSWLLFQTPVTFVGSPYNLVKPRHSPLSSQMDHVTTDKLSLTRGSNKQKLKIAKQHKWIWLAERERWGIPRNHQECMDITTPDAGHVARVKLWDHSEAPWSVLPYNVPFPKLLNC